jgi:hypothetical protein
MHFVAIGGAAEARCECFGTAPFKMAEPRS